MGRRSGQTLQGRELRVGQATGLRGKKIVVVVEVYTDGGRRVDARGEGGGSVYGGGGGG